MGRHRFVMIIFPLIPPTRQPSKIYSHSSHRLLVSLIIEGVYTDWKCDAGVRSENDHHQ
jgi:hypothetical protein